MKKIIIFFLVLVVGKGFGQSVIYTNNCASIVTPPSGSPTFSFASADWSAGDFTFLGVPACTVAGSSGGGHLVTQQGTNSFERIVSLSINTTTFVNIIATWNMYKNSASSPAVAFEWSNDAGATWNAAAYSHTASIGAWGAVPTVSLPSGASGATIYLRWTYTGTLDFNNYILIDDIKISGTPNPSYYWNGVGAITSTLSWGINPDGSGSNPGDFTTPGQNFYLMNAAAATLSGNWTFSGSGSVLNIGDGTVGEAINFTIPSSFALTLGAGAKVNVTNNSTITLQNTSFPSSSEVQLGSNSTVDFAQPSGTTTIWQTTYGNLTLSGGGVKSQAGLTTVNGNFLISSGVTYGMSNSPFVTTQLNGPISCLGSISTASSNLSIGGSSVNPIGTLNFTGNGVISALVLNRISQTLTLGSNLSLSGGLAATQFINGNLDLNGRLITFNAAVTLPSNASNGVFIGSGTSSIAIVGTGAINNSLYMSQATANARTTALTLNRSGATLVLGNNLVLQTALFTNGNLDLNGQTLNLEGATTFPTSTSNGHFIGSSGSSLFVVGSGALTNALLFDQTSPNSRSLGTFNLSRTPSTLALGNNLIVTSVASFTNGVLNLNGAHLTLSGAITFPVNALGRGFLGSLTSSLTIDGTGSISGSLQMGTTNNRLDEFTMNRPSTTLTLGNALEIFGTVYPSAGTLNSNGNLFIRSNATQKGRVAEVLGSLTGNIRVETFAPGGTTDWTNLGVSGVQSQSLPNWDGQIPMSCSGCINDQTSAGGYFVSVQSWNEGAAASSSLAYVEATSGTALTPGKGFWVYLGDNIGTTSDITWTVTGAPVVGPVTVPLSYSGPSNGDGFNLISNPFPSPISWDAVMNSNSANIANLYGAIYVYNADLGVTGSYVNGASGSFGVTDVIPMGQGFYTQVAAPITFSFQESNKIKSNTPLLRATDVNYGSIVKLNVSGGGFSDGTAIRFHSDATADFDRLLDAHKLYSSPGYVGYPGIWNQRTTISTLSNDGDYSVNSLPYAHSADAVIPVLVKVYATGQHTITGTDLENLPNSCVELKDKLLNVTHDLKSGGYVCNISDTTTTPRFELRICMDVAMSVDENKSLVTDNSILINNDENGMYVKFDYKQATKSKISVTNVLGQKIIDDKSVTTINDKVYLNLDAKQQIVFITVSNENQKVTKKVIR